MTRTAILLLASFVASFGAYAGAPEIIDAVEAKYGTVNAMAADFTQTTRSSLYGEQVSKGDMTVARPSKMRWNFGGEQAKQFVTDGKTMWIYSQAEKQVLQYNDVGAASTGATALLQSLDKISEIFDVVVLEDTKLLKKLSLTPKAADGQLKKIVLSLTGDLVVQDLVVTDAFDTETALTFTNVDLAPKVTDALFDFTPPPGAEVISAN